jgi:sugar transferase (PEP-CTERM/EpsH1 system associated)
MAGDARALERVPDVRSECASFSTHLFSPKLQLGRAGFRYLEGSSLTEGFYQTPRVRDAVRFLHKEVRLAATVVFSSVMAHYAPRDIPLLLDMVDVDSEKWFQYSQARRPNFFYRAEGRRLREVEQTFSRLAKCVILTTEQEASILRRYAPDSQKIRAIENGVDSGFFDPHRLPKDPELARRRYVVLVGAMDYYPNSEGAAWFAREVFPRLRERCKDIEFLIVGHQPQHFVQKLASTPGIAVTGYVPDVRPYIGFSLAVVAPLHIARGIQNKVLEALAMGKEVVASAELGRTFGESLPKGLTICGSVDDYVNTIVRIAGSGSREPDFEIRQDTIDRFSWDKKLACLDEELQAIID